MFSLKNEPMDQAVMLWKYVADSKHREGVQKIVAIGKAWHVSSAMQLLEACETLDPSDIYDLVESIQPSSYVIADLVLVAKQSQKSQTGSAGARIRHKENHAMKAEVFVWLDTNRQKFRSMDATAQAITKLQPIAFRTSRDWVGEWKKLRSAGIP